MPGEISLPQIVECIRIVQDLAQAQRESAYWAGADVFVFHALGDRATKVFKKRRKKK